MFTSRSFSRRRFLGLAGGLAAGGVAAGLAGCGSGPAASTARKPTHSASAELPEWLREEAKQYKGRTLSVLGSEQYFATANQDFINACQHFGQATGNTINVSMINVDTGDLVSKQAAAVKAGNVQDLGFVDSGRFVSELHQLGALEPVTDVVTELQTRYGDAHPINKIYLTYGPKKDWYGIPYFSLVNGFFARKDWLREKGIKTSELKTYDDARSVAMELSDAASQRYGWGITYNGSGDGAGAVEAVLNAYGAAVADNTGTKVIFGNGSETKEAVTWMAETYGSSKYSKMLPPGIASWLDTSNNQAWLAGLVGITANAFSLYAQSRAENNPVYGNTYLFGGLTGPATSEVIDIADSEAFVVFKGAKEPGLAKLLAKYLVYGSPLLTMVKQSVGLILPAYEEIWTSNPFYLNGDPAFKSEHRVLDEPLPIKTTTGLSFPQTPSPGTDAVNSAYPICDMVGQIVTKKATIDEAIATCRQRIVQIFEQQGYPQS
jgi:multiple sugar transport system substrate-binding protein